MPWEEWIGVPVPDPGIPREWVLAARDAIKDNEKVSNCGRRFWELTGGVLRCAACGGAMATNYITPRKTGYYRCGRRYRLGAYACSQGKNFRADETEAVVWSFVSRVLKDPERLRRGMDEMLDREGHRVHGRLARMKKDGSISFPNSRFKRNDFSTSTWRGSWNLIATSRGSRNSSDPE